MGDEPLLKIDEEEEDDDEEDEEDDDDEELNRHSNLVLTTAFATVAVFAVFMAISVPYSTVESVCPAEPGVVRIGTQCYDVSTLPTVAMTTTVDTKNAALKVFFIFASAFFVPLAFVSVLREVAQ